MFHYYQLMIICCIL